MTQDQSSNALGLPGADNFVAYLLSVAGGKLTVEGPEVLDWSYDMEYTKRWNIFLDGELLGNYKTFGPKPGESQATLEYCGTIPGYTNDAIVVHNKHRVDGERELPVNQVGLSFSNQRFEAGRRFDDPGKLVETEWQRQDGHEDIPFP